MAKPPKYAIKLLYLFIKDELAEEVLGDLSEKFHSVIRKNSLRKAQINYWIQVLNYLRPFAIKKINKTMKFPIFPIANYLIVAVRMLKKHRVFAFINVAGLSVAICSSFFIHHWVQDESEYNQYLQDGHRVFQVMNNEIQTNGTINTVRLSPQGLKEVLEEKYPMIEQVTILSRGNWMAFLKDEKMIEWGGINASPEIFDMFEMPLVQGAYDKMRTHLKSISVSRSFAETHFGGDWESKNVIGTLMENDLGETYELVAVYEDFPPKSTISFSFIVTYDLFLANFTAWKGWKINLNQLFVKLADGFDASDVNPLITDAINTYTNLENAPRRDVFLQSFEDLYLHNRYTSGKIAGGRIEYVNVLSLGAIFILVLACINFMNLSTARSSQRMKETGVRKVLGARKSTLRGQFLVESILITLLAVLVAALLCLLLFPYYETLTGKELTYKLFSLQNGVFLLCFILGLGVFAGFYPAVYLSSMEVIGSLRGKVSKNATNAFFRRSLVVFQFAVTILMISGALIIYKQVSYIRTTHTGMDRSNLIRTFSYDMDTKASYQNYKATLLGLPGIEYVTIVNQLPINLRNSTAMVQWEGKTNNQGITFYPIDANPDFIPTMKISLKEGRNFDWNLQSDTANYIINETAARMMGMTDPVGKNLQVWKVKGKIIGVIADFNNASLHTSVKPMIIRNDMIFSWMILARSKPGQTQQAIASLEKVFDAFNDPRRTFQCHFMDDTFHAQYKSEMLTERLVWWFTVIAIIISLTGLFSLVAFATEQKTKEVGIRKVLGASVTQIMQLLSKEYAILIFISLVIAIPTSYMLAADWLNGFAYRISLAWSIFGLAAISLIIVAAVVIGLNTLKAAFANPIDHLRNE